MSVNNKRGVVILFAVLLVSVVLGISLGLLSISYRQIILSSVAQESTFAYFAAESALSCAIYWDQKEGVNRPFSYYGWDANTRKWKLHQVGNNGNVLCAGGLWSVDPSSFNPGYGADAKEFTMAFIVNSQSGQRTACARVVVSKKLLQGNSPDLETIIQAYGYNRGAVNNCPNGDANRVVERAIRYQRKG